MTVSLFGRLKTITYTVDCERRREDDRRGGGGGGGDGGGSSHFGDDGSP